MSGGMPAVLPGRLVNAVLATRLPIVALEELLRWIS